MSSLVIKVLKFFLKKYLEENITHDIAFKFVIKFKRFISNFSSLIRFKTFDSKFTSLIDKISHV